MAEADWTSHELREWRRRLRWTQARAAEALCYHVEAYKRLECGTRAVSARVRRLCALTEREHLRSLYQVAVVGPGRQVFASADRALERMHALATEGVLARRGGRSPLRYLSLFSGIEGATAALERIDADAVAVGFAETDAAANAVLRHRWPDVPRLGDIMAVDWSLLRGHLDLVLAGSPCQPFSVAGRRLGLADPRGNLALHMLRAVAALQPRWLVYENVAGLLSANDGGDFGVLLDEVEKLGYSCAWRVLDARYYGLPQRRRRLWLVAEHSGSARGPGAVLDLPEGEDGHPRPSGEAWKAPARRAGGGAVEVDEPDVDWSEADAWLRGPRAPAAAPLVPRQEPRGAILAFKAMGSAEARGIGAAVDEAPTLVAASGGNQVPAVLYAADMRHGTLGDLSPTLQVGPQTGWSANATPFAVHSGPEDRGELVVRRFSPLECLRLQGFDDDWLDGPRLAGRPLSDGDRYRLIGNAWPVPVAAWLLERLLAVHADRGAPSPGADGLEKA